MDLYLALASVVGLTVAGFGTLIVIDAQAIPRPIAIQLRRQRIGWRIAAVGFAVALLACVVMVLT